MSAKSKKAPESSFRDAAALLAPHDRRSFLIGSVAVASALAWPGRLWGEEVPSDADPPPSARPVSEPPAAALALLPNSEFVYVSPLRRDGGESRCHGEVWYGWLDETVVLITNRSTWKSRAIAAGLDRARIWVGNHGRVKGWFGENDDFRNAPAYEARARIERDADLLERLMKQYRGKYPAEIESWEGRMRSGFASGERLLLRYEAV